MIFFLVVCVKGLLKKRFTFRGVGVLEFQEFVFVLFEFSVVVGGQLSCFNWSMMLENWKVEFDSERIEQAGKLVMELVSDWLVELGVCIDRSLCSGMLLRELFLDWLFLSELVLEGFSRFCIRLVCVFILNSFEVFEGCILLLKLFFFLNLNLCFAFMWIVLVEYLFGLDWVDSGRLYRGVCRVKSL